MQLSKNFSLAELTRSYEAERKDIDNSPSPNITTNLKLLATEVLQPIRDALGPVVIKSGYRCPEVNKLVGGSDKSDHMEGLAADIEVQAMSNYALAQWCRDHIPKFNQLILEFYTRGSPSSGWVHISYGTKKIVYTATRENGRTIYTTGLKA